MHLSNLKSNIYQIQVENNLQNLKHKQKSSTKNINNISHAVVQNCLLQSNKNLLLWLKVTCLVFNKTESKKWNRFKAETGS